MDTSIRVLFEEAITILEKDAEYIASLAFESEMRGDASFQTESTRNRAEYLREKIKEFRITLSEG